MNPRATSQISLRRASGVVGAISGTIAIPAAVKASRIPSSCPSGRSGTITPAAPAAAASCANSTAPPCARTMFT